jgi:hypothetical protein
MAMTPNPSPVLRLARLAATAGAVGAAMLLAACTTGSAQQREVQPVASPCVSPLSNTGGDAVSPSLGVENNQRYLFRCDNPKVDYTKGTKTLADLAATVHGLRTAGLKSTPDTSAVIMVERDPSVPWGQDINDAERLMFNKFVSDPSMGDWLIIVADVEVTDGPDPIAPTAYRWERDEVKTFVDCGIPDDGTHNACSEAFSLAADKVVLAPQAGPGHGK